MRDARLGLRDADRAEDPGGSETARLVLDQLGSVDARPELVEAVLAEAPPAALWAPALLEQTRKNKVAEFVAWNLSRVSDLDSPLAKVLRELREYVNARSWLSSKLKPLVHRTLHLAREYGGGVIKGLAAREFYPDRRLRHTGDIDLFFGDADAAVPFVSALLEAGWSWDTRELSWLKWNDEDVPYGQWSLTFQTLGGFSLRVDIHLQCYSCGPSGLLPVGELTEGELDEVPVRTPSAVDLAAIVVAHASGDYLLSMKDVNDLCVLARAGGIDWGAVRAKAAGIGLADVFDQMVAAMSAPKGNLRPGRRSMGPLPLVPSDARSRARHAARCARTFEENLGRDFEAASAVEAMAFRYYTANIEPRRGSAQPAAPDTKNRNRWTCWRLVPPRVWLGLTPDGEADGVRGSEELFPGVEMLTTDHGSLVLWGGDFLIPTVWGDIHGGTLALARALHP